MAEHGAVQAPKHVFLTFENKVDVVDLPEREIARTQDAFRKYAKAQQKLRNITETTPFPVTCQCGNCPNPKKES